MAEFAPRGSAVPFPQETERQYFELRAFRRTVDRDTRHIKSRGTHEGCEVDWSGSRLREVAEFAPRGSAVTFPQETEGQYLELRAFRRSVDRDTRGTKSRGTHEGCLCFLW